MHYKPRPVLQSASVLLASLHAGVELLGGSLGGRSHSALVGQTLGTLQQDLAEIAQVSGLGDYFGDLSAEVGRSRTTELCSNYREAVATREFHQRVTGDVGEIERLDDGKYAVMGSERKLLPSVTTVPPR